MQLKFKKLNNSVITPKYHTEGSAGFDLHSLETKSLEPNEIYLFSTGIFIEVPEGYEAQVRPRSGLATKNGITVINTPGTVDSDYRGEVKVALINLGKKEIIIHKDDRIAQVIISPIIQCELIETDELSNTDRNQNGFGSTGK